MDEKVPKTGYITWNSFRIKWVKNESSIGKDIRYQVIVFTDKTEYEKILLEYIDGYFMNYMDLFQKMKSVKKIKLIGGQFTETEVDELDKNTDYYICVIEVDIKEYNYNKYPMAYAKTSTGFFLRKLFELYQTNI